jgi:hypothetical protein
MPLIYYQFCEPASYEKVKIKILLIYMYIYIYMILHEILLNLNCSGETNSMHLLVFI